MREPVREEDGSLGVWLRESRQRRGCEPGCGRCYGEETGALTKNDAKSGMKGRQDR